MTKILFNGNRIIIDGHADTAEECRAITAMCDSMANDENFKTIVYESGHAVFERVSGGESLKFSDLEAQIQNLQLQIAALQGLGDMIDGLDTRLTALEEAGGGGASSEEVAELSRKIDNILTSMYKLPYTVSQIEEKLANQ